MNVSSSGNGMLLYGAAEALQELTWLDREGKPVRVVGQPREPVRVARLSPDGRHIMEARNDENHADLWLGDGESGLFNRFTLPTGNSFPVWSPDGRTILFTKVGAHSLYRKETSGLSDEELVIQRPAPPFAVDWSADGRWVLVVEPDSTAKTDLWVYPVMPNGKLREGAEPKPYMRTPFNEFTGFFSPESSPRWLAFESDESGTNEVYIDAFPTPHGKKRIAVSGGTWPQWSASGRELFYLSPDSRVMVVSLNLAGDSVEPSSPPRELFRLPEQGIATMAPYAVTRDGRRFLVRTPHERSASPLTVLVNWPALLEKRL
jgi:Tol biopolymer transport system component